MYISAPYAQLAQAYKPLTAHPFETQSMVQEYRPCAALRPYIRCFWGDAAPGLDSEPAATLVIPDTCMDIIFHIDHSTGAVAAHFCGLDDAPAVVHHAAGRQSTLFAIRFYAWTAALFAEQNLRGSKNGRFAAEAFFPKLYRTLAPQLPYLTTMPARIALATTTLLAGFAPRQQPAVLPQAIGALLQSGGSLSATALARTLFLSTRQLERIFDDQLGVAPKSMAGLLRYQCLWRAMLHAPHNFDVQTAVARYGFTDQAHLLHTFKRYHGMTPRQAVRVAFLQDELAPQGYTGSNPMPRKNNSGG